MEKSIHTLFLYCPLILLLAGTGYSQSLTYHEALQKSLHDNPGLKALECNTKAAESGLQQAGALVNPEVEIVLDKFGINELEAGISQTIELGGKRNARKRQAGVEVAAAKIESDAGKTAIEAAVSRRFSSALAIQQRADVLDSLIELAHETVEQIHMRVQQGAARETDLLRAELEIQDLQFEKKRLLRELENAYSALSVLWGETGPGFQRLSGIFVLDETLPDFDTIAGYFEKHPLTQALELDRDRAEAQLLSARTDKAPDLTIGVGVIRAKDEPGVSPALGASIALPLFDRKKNLVAQEQYRVEAQTHAIKREHAFRMQQVKSVYTTVQGTAAELQALDAEVVPRAENVYAKVSQHYANGASSILDLHDARRTLFEVLTRRNELLAEHAAGCADLYELTGYRVDIIAETK